MKPEDMKPDLDHWSAAYQAATGNDARIVEVWARRGRFGGLAIWCEDEDGRTFSPYLDPSPGDGQHTEPDWDGRWRDEQGRYCRPCGCDACALERHGSDFWVSMMEGATDWEGCEWTEQDSGAAY